MGGDDGDDGGDGGDGGDDGRAGEQTAEQKAVKRVAPADGNTKTIPYTPAIDPIPATEFEPDSN